MGARLVACAAVLATGAGGEPDAWGACDATDCLDIRFLWTSRLEGRYLPVTSSGAPCDPDASAACFAGAARRIAYVEQERKASEAKNRSVVFMDLGGSTFGGPLNGHPGFPLGTPEAILRNMTPYDVCAFGPRDFMVTSDPQQMAELPASYATHACPTVVSNAKLTGPWEAFGNKTLKYLVRTMSNGWKVGFLGMVPYSASIGYSYGAGALELDRGSMLAQVFSGAFKSLRIKPASLRSQVEELQAEVLRMADYPADVFTLSTVESVDTLAIAEHVRFANPDMQVLVLLVPYNDREDQVRWMAQNGPFDVIVRESWPELGTTAEVVRSEVYDKPVLIAGSESLTGLGSLQVRFRSGHGVEKYIFSGNVPLSSSVPSDASAQAVMSSLYEFTRQRNALPYGVITNPLVGGHRGGETGPTVGQCYWTDCPAANTIGRAILWKARSLGYKVSLSLSNLGGLRAPLTGDANKTVFISHCQRTLAFQDVLGLYTILGKDLLATLKGLMVPQERGFIGAGVRAAFFEPCFDYVSHTNYSYVTGAPPGDSAGLAKCAAEAGVTNPNIKVIDVQVQQVNWDNCKDYTKCEDVVWMQLQKGTTYTVVTRQFLASQFAGFKPLGRTVGTDAQALCDFIAADSPVQIDPWQAYRDRGSVQYATPQDGWAAGNRVPSVRVPVSVLDSAPTCPDGMYLDASAKGCVRCPAGTHSSADAARESCEACALGFFGNESGLPRCTACPAGFFSNQAASTSCESCPAGTFSDMGAIYCNGCKAGSYAPDAGSDVCRLCPRGAYADAARRTSCAACPAGFVTVYPGAQSADECICPAGAYRTLAVNNGSADCAGAGNDSQACATAAGTCAACPEGMFCDAGSDLRNFWLLRGGAAAAGGVGPYPVLQPRFWSDPSEPLSVYRCDTSLLCPGGDPGTCANEDTIGLSCALCAPQHYATPRGCKPCRRVDAAPMIVVFVAAALLAGLLAAISLADTDSTRFSLITVALTAGQLVCTVQMMGVFKEFKVPWLEPLATLMDLAGLVAFKVYLLKPECFLGRDSPVLIFLIRLLVLPTLALLLAIIMLLVSAVRRGLLRLDCDRFQNALGLLFVMLYVSITVSMVEPLQCTRHPNGKSSMSSNFSVLCWETAEHRALVAMSAVGFVCYPVAMLTRVALVTWRYPAIVASGGGLQLLRRFRFLFARFRPECHFWGFWYLSRNLLLPLVPVVVPNNSLWQIFLAGLLLHTCCYFQASLSPWKTPTANMSEVVSLVGLLIFIQTASFLSDSGVRTDPKTVSILLFYVIIITLAMVVVMLLGSVLRHFWPGVEFHIFLSHHKEGAGSLARWFKLQLTSLSFNARVFLDSDELDNLELIVEIVRSRTKNLVVLLTKMTLTRVWCAAEIAAAKAFNVNILLVTCSDYVPPDDDFIKNLKGLWSAQQQQVLVQYGVPIEHVKSAYEYLTTVIAIPLERFDSIECQQDVVRMVWRACDLAKGSVQAITRMSSGLKRSSTGISSRPSTETSSGKGGGALATLSFKRADSGARGLTAQVSNSWSLATPAATKAPPSPPKGARILICGASLDPEARSACEVLRMLVERKTGSTAATIFACADTHAQWPGTEFLLVMLTRGLLRDPGFMEVGIAFMGAKMSGRDAPIGVVAALADGNFPFPAPEFYTTVDPPSFSSFMRAVFNVLAVPFSPHAGFRIMDVQVQELCKRFQRQSLVAESEGEIQHKPSHLPVVSLEGYDPARGQPALALQAFIARGDEGKEGWHEEDECN